MTDRSPSPSALIVEDDDSIALALAFVLRREGCRLDRIATGAGAIERIRADRPDLVLLDIMLPSVSGDDICRLVRRDPALRDVRIILMTASRTTHDRKDSLAQGADGFLFKPFDMSDLRATVRRLLP